MPSSDNKWGKMILKNNLEIGEDSKNIRIRWKKKMIEEHLKGLNWHKECIERLEKEIIELEKK